MNKKALALLSLALSLTVTPTVSIGAQEPTEFEDMVENETAGQIRLDASTFPDTNFRMIVRNVYGLLKGMDVNKLDQSVPDGIVVNTADLARITSLSVNYFGQDNRINCIDWYPNLAPGGPMEFKDLRGIEYLTGLKSLILLHSPNLQSINLSANTNLETLILAPLNGSHTGQDIDSLFPADPSDSYNPAEPIPSGPSALGTNYLSHLVLPSNPGKLEELNIQGAANLTSLDLTACIGLKSLTLYNNNIEGLGLPASGHLTRLEIPNNRLYSLDVSRLPNLSLLNVANNRLENLDLSNNSALANLNVSYNHLATLDLSAQANGPLGSAQPWKNGVCKKGSMVNGEWRPSSTTRESGLAVSPQLIYALKEDGQMGIDLKAYDPSFHNLSNGVGWTDPKNGNIASDGIMTLSGAAEYCYKTGLGSSGAGGENMIVKISPIHLMNRLYNPNSGEHFYTSDSTEANALIGYGWKNEGIGWVAPSDQSIDASSHAQTVYRLYNPNAGDHHYTLDVKEKDSLVRMGWVDEGARWYSAKAQSVWGNNESNQSLSARSSNAGYSIPIYRQYNPNATSSGSHNYTVDKVEDLTLISNGWKAEGIGWYGLK